MNGLIFNIGNIYFLNFQEFVLEKYKEGMCQMQINDIRFTTQEMKKYGFSKVTKNWI